jgi:5,10-methylenetetrahydromethanopterin reductase
LARAADELCETLWYADERFFRDCYTALMFCGSATSRVRLGTCVTDPYSRHPAITAASIASLDEFTGGRAILGLGAGVSGFKQMGIERARPALAIRETIELTRRLLGGEHLTFEGQVVRFYDGGLDFPSRPDLPIWVATQSPLTLRVAGELADGVIVEAYTSEQVLEFVRDQMKIGATKSGRQVDSVPIAARLDTCIASTFDEAAGLVKPRIARNLMLEWPELAGVKVRGLSVPPALEERIAGVGYTRDPQILGRAAAEIPDEWVPEFALAGTPADVATQMRALVSRGIGQLIVWPLPVPGQQDEVDVLRTSAELLSSVTAV